MKVTSDILVLSGESEENLRMRIGRSGELCKTKVPKVNVDKSSVMMLGRRKDWCAWMGVEGRVLWSLSTLDLGSRNWADI